MSQDILLTQITPDPANARQYFDPTALQELATSIEASGLASPILLRPVGDGYIIVHGERRFRAVNLLGWATIPAEVRDLTPEQASWLALVENVQRENLTVIEEALAYKAKLAQGITQTELGRRIGKSQSHIATKLRLLGLPELVQRGVTAGTITEGHAKQLLRLDDLDLMANLYNATVNDELNVRKLKDMVDETLKFVLQKNDEDGSYLTADQRLVRARVEKFNSTVWSGEDFIFCGNRYFGSVVRLIWLYRPSNVYFTSFGAQTQQVELAAKSMSCDITQDISEADMLFVHIPPDVTKAEAYRIVNDAVAGANEFAKIAVRFGPMELDGDQNMDHYGAVLDNSRFKPDDTTMPFCVILSTKEELERYQKSDAAHAAGKRHRLITNHEDWFVAGGGL